MLRGHPWIFAGALADEPSDVVPGDTVEITAADGTWLARGAWSPSSHIRIRVWTRNRDEPVDAGWIQRRLEQSVAWRVRLGLVGPGLACRLVFGESDGLPGLVVDRYDHTVVCQFSAVGMERWKPVVAEALSGLEGVVSVFERSDIPSRRYEGLEPMTGLLAGREPKGPVEIREGDCRYRVDVRAGHKTGFYLDQRVNRGLVAGWAAGRRMLNAFSYTGAFGIAALRAGAAHVVQVDSSGPALNLARDQASLNDIDPARCECVEADVGQYLRRCRDAARTFDLVVLDPPKFAETKTQVEGACRAYKDINLLALKLLAPGGLLFTFSCSGHISPDLFHKVVASAGVDARRSARIVGWMDQPADHPVGLEFPESRYLKGLIVAAD